MSGGLLEREDLGLLGIELGLGAYTFRCELTVPFSAQRCERRRDLHAAQLVDSLPDPIVDVLPMNEACGSSLVDPLSVVVIQSE